MFELKSPLSPAPVSLRCTRGAPVPDGFVDEARSILALPEAVKAQFDRVLLPYLRGEPSEEDQTWLSRLSADHDLEPAQLVGPIRASRFLVMSAIQTAQTRETLSEDIAHLHDDPRAIRELIEILLPVFERAAPELRTSIIERTLAEHGRLVEAAHWRVDKIVNSEHGDGLNVPVAVLTFDYREGDKRDRITLHLLPEQLNQLKNACLSMIPEGEG